VPPIVTTTPGKAGSSSSCFPFLFLSSYRVTLAGRMVTKVTVSSSSPDGVGAGVTPDPFEFFPPSPFFPPDVIFSSPLVSPFFPPSPFFPVLMLSTSVCTYISISLSPSPFFPSPFFPNDSNSVIPFLLPGPPLSSI